MISSSSQRPLTTVVLAISLDGKIADFSGTAARFGSQKDKAHLEKHIAHADAVLFGANTLRAYGTTLPITNPSLLEQRQQAGKPDQPVHIVCSPSGEIDPNLRFFQQPVPRWLITTSSGQKRWQAEVVSGCFAQVLLATTVSGQVVWQPLLQRLQQKGIQQLLITGGSQLVGSLLADQVIDELWITICPLLLGGDSASCLISGVRFLAEAAPRLSLQSLRSQDDEVFLHYRVKVE